MENYIEKYEDWIDIGTYRREEILNGLVELVEVLRAGEPKDNYSNFIRLLKKMNLFDFIGMDIYMIKRKLYNIYYRYSRYQTAYIAYIPVVMYIVSNKQKDATLGTYFLNETSYSLNNILIKYNILNVQYNCSKKMDNITLMFKILYYENGCDSTIRVDMDLDCREYIRDLNMYFPDFKRKAADFTNNFDIERDLMTDITHLNIIKQQYDEVNNYLIEEYS